MFLFPWLDWGIDISDFEKIDFLGHERFLAFSAPWKRVFFDIGGYFEGPIKNAQGKNFEIFFLGIFQKNSQVLRHVFWAFYDHMTPAD